MCILYMEFSTFTKYIEIEGELYTKYLCNSFGVIHKEKKLPVIIIL